MGPQGNFKAQVVGYLFRVLEKGSAGCVLNERRILSQLNHPFLINMHRAFQDARNLYLLMDYLRGADLRYHICYKEHFHEEEIRTPPDTQASSPPPSSSPSNTSTPRASSTRTSSPKTSSSRRAATLASPTSASRSTRMRRTGSGGSPAARPSTWPPKYSSGGTTLTSQIFMRLGSLSSNS